MEYHNNTLCISGEELVISKKNPNGVIDKFTYENYLRSGKFKRLKRGCLGRTSLIDFDSVLNSVPSGIRELLLNTKVTPAQQATDKPFRDKIVIDEKAVAFYLGYEYDSENPEKRLPKDKQREYVVNASVLNAIKCEWDETSIARKRAGGSMKGFWKEANEFVTRITTELQAKPEDVLYMMNLPLNQISLKRKFKRYVHGEWIGEGEDKRFVIGYEALIKDQWCNKKAEKITGDILDWVVKEMGEGRQSIDMVVMRYPAVAKANGWRLDITASAFKTRVAVKEVRQMIELARFGPKAFRKLNGHTNKLTKAKYSNDIWVSDGTSVSWYYKTPAYGKKGTFLHFAPAMCTTYMVMDARSWKILGLSTKEGINKENFVMQLEAYRMALRVSGAKPYQLLYDNQGGHKNAESKVFYSNLSHVHFATRAYRPSGKPVEQMFKNFQTLKLAEYPFWTGFGRESHSDLRYKPDMESIERNIENIPTFEELTKLLDVAVAEWNDLDFSGKGSPNQIYAESRNPEEQPIAIDDLAELFWNMSSERRYMPTGIILTYKGEELFYEVHTPEGDVDFDFRRKHLKEKFFIKYDPDMEYKDVELYQVHPTGGFQLIAKAQPKREVSRSVKYLNEGDRAWIDKQMAGEDEYFEKLESDMKETGYTEEVKWTKWRDKITEQVPVMANNDDNEVDFRDKM